MKRLLYLAYFFPPLGGAGVQRSLKFARYLPQAGWRVTILTARTGYWMQDPSLLAELDPAMRVLRAPFYGGRLAHPRSASRSGTHEGARSATPRSRARVLALRSAARFFLVPDSYLGWVLPAGRLALSEIAAARSVDPYRAILTTSSPDSAHLLGRFLKRHTGVAWLADFRDPWTRRMTYAPPTRFHDRLHHRLERSCLAEADGIVVTNEETRHDFLRRYTELDAGKITVIPNGYDEGDFEAAERLLSERGSCTTEVVGDPSDPHVILHAGQLNPERSIEPFLRGLRLLLARRPQSRVQTLFLGGHYDHDLRLVRDYGLEGVVRFRPGRPHVESVAALLQARILLLLEQNSDRGRLILPGKAFEYLRAGRPILAVVPRGGAAARFVEENEAGIVADPAKPEEIALAIEALLERTCTEDASTEKAAAWRGRTSCYERRSLARELGWLLDTLTGSA